MVFNSRVVPLFMLWLPKISGSSIYVLPVKRDFTDFDNHTTGYHIL